MAGTDSGRIREWLTMPYALMSALDAVCISGYSVGSGRRLNISAG